MTNGGCETAGISAHPAVRAWQQLRVGRAPVSVDAVKFADWKKAKTLIYRLIGCVPGDHPVIAKCGRASKLDVEQRIYTQVLGPLGIDLPHCYGYVDDPGGATGWLFLEEVSGVQYSEEDAGQRFLASSWLGKMHAATSVLGPAVILPRVTLDRHRRSLDVALASLLRSYPHQDLTDMDRHALASAARALERLARHWPLIGDLWTLAPRCLVHGDFIAKNVLVDDRGAQPRIGVLDWGRSGWGVPAEDLAGLDIGVYTAHASTLWTDFGQARLRLLAEIGSAFRAIGFLEDYSVVIADRIVHVVDEISHYGGLLEAVEDRLGW